jgi:hypothetical protein
MGTVSCCVAEFMPTESQDWVLVSAPQDRCTVDRGLIILRNAPVQSYYTYVILTRHAYDIK